MSKQESEDSQILEMELEKQVYQNHSYVFGFESFRNSLWGHEIMKELDCELLYSLRKTDIFVFDNDIIRLKNELHVVLANIQSVAGRTNLSEETIEVRVSNALAYLALAEENIENIGITIA